MGHRGFNRQWARYVEDQWAQHGGQRGGPWGGGWGGPWGASWGGPGPGGRGNPGPPPWVAGLFGLAQGERQRGPRVRRGDVRSAILDVVRAAQEAGEQLNGYQVIQQIAARSDGAWRPSPGSVYPTIAQLEDEGLLETTDGASGRRSLRLTAAGEEYVAAHAAELAAVWAPFRRAERDGDPAGTGSASEAGSGAGAGADGGDDRVELRPEIGQVMNAVWQIVTTGTEAQRQAAIGILVDARRRLYGVLADGDPAEDPDADPEADPDAGIDPDAGPGEGRS